MAEFAPVLFVFFLMVLFPLINLVGYATAAATVFLISTQACVGAQNSPNFQEALTAVENTSRNLTNSGFGRFARLNPVGGINGCGADLYVVELDYVTNNSTTYGPNTGLPNQPDPAKIYEYYVRTNFSINPFLNLSGVPGIGAVPIVGQPANLVYNVCRNVEHQEGLLAFGGGGAGGGGGGSGGSGGSGTGTGGGSGGSGGTGTSGGPGSGGSGGGSASPPPGATGTGGGSGGLGGMSGPGGGSGGGGTSAGGPGGGSGGSGGIGGGVGGGGSGGIGGGVGGGGTGGVGGGIGGPVGGGTGGTGTGTGSGTGPGGSGGVGGGSGGSGYVGGGPGGGGGAPPPVIFTP